MIPNWCTPKNVILVAAIVLFACVAGGVATGLAYPEPVSSAALGPDWQCSRMAFVWTTCRRLTHAKSASIRVAREPVCTRIRT
jgi:hypothetical protein